MRLTLFVGPLALLALLGCARTKGWRGGDSCTQLSKNAEEIRDLEDRMARLQAEGSSTDSVRQAEVARLEERKRDLQRNNAQLVGSCAPPEGTGPETDYQKRRRERLPESR